MLSSVFWLPEDQPRSRQVDAEKFAAAALHKHLRRSRSTLQEHQFEEALAYLIEQLWEASRNWDPAYGISFSTWATRYKLNGFIVEWYRRTFYDARDQSTDPSRSSVAARRELAFASSLNVLIKSDYSDPSEVRTDSESDFGSVLVAPEPEQGELEFVVGALTGNAASGGPGTLAGILGQRDRDETRDLDLVNQRRSRAAA